MSLIQFCAIIFVFFVTVVTSTDLIYYYQTKNITTETFIGKEIQDVHFLDFRGCEVETISNNAFDDFNNLNHIMFVNNHIETLPDGVFDKLENIEIIRLGVNKLKQFSKNVFSNINKLHTLDLSYNSISTIEIGSFDNDEKLSTIHLNFNILTVIPVGVFNNLQELTHLDISNNLLHTIEESALPNFQKLTSLFMHANKLKHVNKNDLEYVTTSTLDNNPWFCDCKLKEVHDKWETTFKNQGWTPICYTPKKIHNVRWDLLPSDDFVCSVINLEIYPELNEIPAEYGRSISLNCYVTGGARVSNVKWTYKNDTEVEDVLKDEGRSFSVNFNIVKNDDSTIVGLWYNITINKVIRADDGVYKCVVNQNNQIYEAEKRVIVDNALELK